MPSTLEIESPPRRRETALRELQVPLRLINSDYNPTNVVAGQEATSSFEVVLMSGVGHFVMMEDPETFNRLLGEIVEDSR